MSSARRTLWTVLGLVALVGAGVTGYLVRIAIELGAKRNAADRVTATLQVQAVPPTILPAEDRIRDPTEFETYKQNLGAAFKSSAVINKALDARSVQGLPVVREHAADLTEWLSDQIDFQVSPHSELISISLAVGDRNQGKKILDALLAAFNEEVIDRERSDRLARKLLLDKKYRDYKQAALERRRQLFDLSQQIGTPDASGAKARNRIEMDVLDNLVRSKSEIEKRISEIDLRIALSKRSAADGEQVSPEAEVEAAIAKDPQIQQATTELADLERDQRAAEKVVKNASDPALVRIRNSVNAAHQRIEALKAADRQQVLDGLKRRGESTGSGVASLELERKLLNEQLIQATKNIEAQRGVIVRLDRFNGDVDELRQEIEQLDAFLKQMSDMLTRMNIELDAPSRVRVYQTAN